MARCRGSAFFVLGLCLQVTNGFVTGATGFIGRLLAGGFEFHYPRLQCVLAVRYRLSMFNNKQSVETMLAAIDRHFQATASSTGLSGMSSVVRGAIAATPRDLFVPSGERAGAFSDNALPIGHYQTISQPFIVALMTELLQPCPGDRVLEIGTGSGYQAAVLAHLVDHVYSVEIVEPLAETALQRLRAMQLDNITVVASNGANGFPDFAPYDKIIITAAAGEIPEAIDAQLSTDGLIVAPLGESGYGQQLAVLRKSATGALQRRDVLPVSFVPFTGR